jgi:hypothetical protein
MNGRLLIGTGKNYTIKTEQLIERGLPMSNVI